MPERSYEDEEREAFAAAVRLVTEELADMLIAKNLQYGNSALNPIRVFARDVDLVAQLRVRLDDKLSRLQLGDPSAETEDTEQDLLGYLVLLRVARTWRRRHLAEPVKA